MRRASVSASARPISARAWPAVSSPPAPAPARGSGSFSSRSVLATMAAALADDLGQLLLGVAEALDQLAIAGRLLDRVEVGALHVLDDRELEHFLVVELAHDDRHRVQAGLLRRAPAALAGDDLVAAARASGRTMIGCTRPLERIDSASSASSSSRKSLRGLSRLALQLGDRHQALLALRRQRSLPPAPARRSGRRARGRDGSSAVVRSWVSRVSLSRYSRLCAGARAR